MNQSNWFSLEEIELQQQLALADDKKKVKIPSKIPNQSMEEILAQYEIEELNSNLFKYCIEAVQNADPLKKVNEKSRIKVFCEERDGEGNILNRNASNIQATRISMASNIPMIQGLRTSFLTMHEGDSAWFKICNNQLYTTEEIASGVQVIAYEKYYKISITEVIQPSIPLDLSILENRLSQMQLFKEEGNDLYRQANYNGAIVRYQKGLNFLEKWPKKFEDNVVAIRAKEQSFIVLSTNKAQCFLKLMQYQNVIQVLEPLVGQMRNTEYEIKSYYRLIQSLIKIGESDKAKQYYSQVSYLCSLTNDQQQLFRSLM